MKTRISAGLVVLAVSLVTFAAMASVASANTSKGKLTSFAYNADTKVGYLTLLIKGDKTRFRVPRSADCGVSYGQSGDQIPCRTLGKDKYHGRVVTARWERGKNNRRVVSLASVRMY